MTRWAPVRDYVGLYVVSEFGEVRSLPKKMGAGPAIRAGRALVQKPGVDPKYVRVCLWKEGKRRWFYVHRLILLSFVGPPEHEEMQACHSDGDSYNNCLDNLRWDYPRNNRAEAGFVRCAATGQWRSLEDDERAERIAVSFWRRDPAQLTYVHDDLSIPF